MKINFLIFCLLNFCQLSVLTSLLPPIENKLLVVSQPAKSETFPRKLKIKKSKNQNDARNLLIKLQMGKLVDLLEDVSPETAAGLKNKTLKQQKRYLQCNLNSVGNFINDYKESFMIAGAVGFGVMLTRAIQFLEFMKLTKQVREKRRHLIISSSQKRKEIAQTEVLISKLEDDLDFLSQKTTSKILELNDFVDSSRFL